MPSAHPRTCNRRRPRRHGAGRRGCRTPLNTLAERLAGEKNLEGATAVQEFNLRVNPDIATSYSLLANLYQQKGDRAAARAQIEKAIEPSEAFYKRRLQELQPTSALGAAVQDPSPSPR